VSAREQVEHAARAAGTAVTRIGRIDEAGEAGMRLVDGQGQPLARQQFASFDHFG